MSQLVYKSCLLSFMGNVMFIPNVDASYKFIIKWDSFEPRKKVPLHILLLLLLLYILVLLLLFMSSCLCPIPHQVQLPVGYRTWHGAARSRAKIHVTTQKRCGVTYREFDRVMQTQRISITL